MNQSLFITGIVISCAIFSSCSQRSENTAERELTQLNNYLDSVKTATTQYTLEGWEKIKTQYNRTVEEVNNSGEQLSDEANKKLEAAKAEYNALKSDFEMHTPKATVNAEPAEPSENRHTLRRDLFGNEKIGDDMQFKFVTAKNALPVYERFVHTVKENKDKYSREDWDEIKLLYEALDTRKNEIEKDLATEDNLKIAKLKVQFATLNTLKRPVSKIEENADAKQ